MKFLGIFFCWFLVSTSNATPAVCSATDATGSVLAEVRATDLPPGAVSVTTEILRVGDVAFAFTFEPKIPSGPYIPKDGYISRSIFSGGSRVYQTASKGNLTLNSIELFDFETGISVRCDNYNLPGL